MGETVVTTVILIRHGERTPSPSDPPEVGPHLNADGRRRAQTLVHVLGDAGIKAIYVSRFIRTKETAAPLASHFNPDITPTEIDQAIDIKNHILANHAGKTVLVIGHTDTVPDVIDQFAGGNMPDIDGEEFDNLFVVTIFDTGKASVVKLKYGKPSLPV